MQEEALKMEGRTPALVNSSFSGRFPVSLLYTIFLGFLSIFFALSTRPCCNLSLLLIPVTVAIDGKMRSFRHVYATSLAKFGTWKKRAYLLKEDEEKSELR